MADQKQNSKSQTQATAKAQSKQEAASTQAYLPIKEVKDGVVILKDGSLRAVLMTSAVNFALKSGGEQDAIIFAYQRFLNSLTFPVQVLIQSRRLDLDFYIDKLNKRAEAQTIELVKLQILEYTDFIKRLISVTNIMDKRFFVVVPFYPAATEQAAKGVAKLFSTGNTPKPTNTKQSEDEFQKNKVQLMQRVEALASGLGGVGLRAATLNSEELVELFYSIYNPSTSTKQRLVNVDDLTAASIEREPTGSGQDRAIPISPQYQTVRDQKDETSSANQPAQTQAPAQNPAPDQGENHG